MIYELFLAGNIADIRQDVGMQVSYTIDDINKYGSRDTSFSKTIVLPGTANNNKIFGFINELGTKNDYNPNGENIGYNFNVAQPTPCELRANGLLLLKGIFRLTGIIRTVDSFEYEGNLFGELGGFISEINGRKLQDLNFNEYNHEYSIANISNSWDTIDGSGYYYPLIDHGTYSTDKKDYSYPTFRPALYVKEYLDKMFSEIGYTYQSNFFESAFFRSLIIPNNSKELRTSNSLQLDLGATPSDTGTDSNFFFSQANKLGDFTTTDNITFEYTGTTSFNPIFKLDLYSGVITDQRNTTFLFKVKLQLEKTVGGIVNYNFDSFNPVYDFLVFPERLNLNINVASFSWTNLGGIPNVFKSVLILLGNPLGIIPGIIIASGTYTVNTGETPIVGSTFTIAGLDQALDGDYEIDSVQITFIVGPGITSTRFLFKEQISKPILNKACSISYFPNHRQNVNVGFKTLGNGAPWSRSFQLNTTIDQGDKVKVFITGYNDGTLTLAPFTAQDNNIFVDSVFTINSQVPILTRTVLGEEIIVNDVIPRNVFQKDFFVWLMQMFNLYVTEDKFKSKHLIIEPYIDFYNLSDSDDWSYKIARDKPWNIKPMGMLNGRFFEYKFKDDNDFYNENHKKKWNRNYGDRLEDSGFQFAKEKQTISIGFSPTILAEYAGCDKIVSSIFKKSTGNNVIQEERMDSNIRILIANKITDVDNWWILIYDAKGKPVRTGGGFTAYGYAGHFDHPRNPSKDINFGAADQIYFNPNYYTSNNLFNDYWSGYVAEIADKDSKILTCHVYLTELDIANLDFSKPVFIDGVLWRINKIMDFDPSNNELTKVEFLKVINNG